MIIFVQRRKNTPPYNAHYKLNCGIVIIRMNGTEMCEGGSCTLKYCFSVLFDIGCR